MSYTETPNLKLKKDDGNEKIANWRPHSNGNMDILDEAVQNLVEVCANAKSLLGQLGLDESGNPLVNAASARNTLGAATSGGASKSLYAAEQSIATNAGNISKNTTNISKNATDIQTLRDSVSLDSTTLTRVQFNQKTNDRYGTIIFYGHNGGYGVIFDSSGITLWDMTQGKEIKHMNWTR